MVGFLVRNLIAGKITWKQLTGSEKYSKYADAVTTELNLQGYKIYRGKCVKVDE